jgi:hypothetical protein
MLDMLTLHSQSSSEANKAFKSDSQRLAFFILSLVFLFTVVWWLRCSHLTAMLSCVPKVVEKRSAHLIARRFE